MDVRLLYYAVPVLKYSYSYSCKSAFTSCLTDLAVRDSYSAACRTKNIQNAVVQKPTLPESGSCRCKALRIKYLQLSAQHGTLVSTFGGSAFPRSFLQSTNYSRLEECEILKAFLQTARVTDTIVLRVHLDSRKCDSSHQRLNWYKPTEAPPPKWFLV